MKSRAVEQWERDMVSQLNGGPQPLVRTLQYREYKRLIAEVTAAGQAQREKLALRLLESFNDRFRDDPDMSAGEPRIVLMRQGDTVHRYPPQTIKPEPLD